MNWVVPGGKGIWSGEEKELALGTGVRAVSVPLFQRADGRKNCRGDLRAEASLFPCAPPQAPRSSWCPPRTARSMPPRMFPWPAGLRRTPPTSLIAGSRTASTCSTLGGAWGWAGDPWAALEESPGSASLDPCPHVPHCSRLQPRVRILVDGSLRLLAAQPDDAGRYTCVPSNGLRRPPSASAYLTVLCKPHPAPSPSLLPPPGPGQVPAPQPATASPTRPSAGDSDAS